MNNKKTILVIGLILILCLGGAYILYEKLGDSVEHNQLVTENNGNQEVSDKETDSEHDEERTLAPDFKVYDFEGNEVRLSDYIGKPIILNFWASWCGPCQSEMPDFEKKYIELKEDVNFLMVNMTDGSRETVEKASEFIKGKGYTFPVFYDKDYDAAKTYRAYSLPTTYFIDAEGYMIAHATGALDADTLQQGIDMIVKK